MVYHLLVAAQVGLPIIIHYMHLEEEKVVCLTLEKTFVGSRRRQRDHQEADLHLHIITAAAAATLGQQNSQMVKLRRGLVN